MADTDRIIKTLSAEGFLTVSKIGSETTPDTFIYPRYAMNSSSGFIRQNKTKYWTSKYLDGAQERPAVYALFGTSLSKSNITPVNNTVTYRGFALVEDSAGKLHAFWQVISGSTGWMEYANNVSGTWTAGSVLFNFIGTELGSFDVTVGEGLGAGGADHIFVSYVDMYSTYNTVAPVIRYAYTDDTGTSWLTGTQSIGSTIYKSNSTRTMLRAVLNSDNDTIVINMIYWAWDANVIAADHKSYIVRYKWSISGSALSLASRIDITQYLLH